jgi:hypothetical protein
MDPARVHVAADGSAAESARNDARGHGIGGYAQLPRRVDARKKSTGCPKVLTPAAFLLKVWVIFIPVEYFVSFSV